MGKISAGCFSNHFIVSGRLYNWRELSFACRGDNHEPGKTDIHLASAHAPQWRPGGSCAQRMRAGTNQPRGRCLPHIDRGWDKLLLREGVWKRRCKYSPISDCPEIMAARTPEPPFYKNILGGSLLLAVYARGPSLFPPLLVQSSSWAQGKGEGEDGRGMARATGARRRRNGRSRKGEWCGMIMKLKMEKKPTAKGSKGLGKGTVEATR